MARETVIKELHNILGQNDFTDDMNLFDDLALSSMEIFELFSALEDKLSISIKEEVISDIATIGDLIDVVEHIVDSGK